MLADARNSSDGRCFPSIKTLALYCGLNRSTVMTSIAELEEKGLISCQKVPGKSTHYTFHLETEPVGHTDPLPVGHTDHPPVGESNRSATPTGRPEQHDRSATPTTPVGHADPNQKEPEVTSSLSSDRMQTSKVSFNEEDIGIVKSMWEFIQPVTADRNPPDWPVWAYPITQLRRAKDISVDLITKVFKHGFDDPFWRDKVLSPHQFARNFDKIKVQMESKSHANTRPNARANQQPRRLSAGDEVRAVAAQRAAEQEREVVAVVGGDG